MPAPAARDTGSIYLTHAKHIDRKHASSQFTSEYESRTPVRAEAAVDKDPPRVLLLLRQGGALGKEHVGEVPVAVGLAAGV